MNTVFDLFKNLWSTLGCVGELLGYLLRFVSAFFRTRASLAARLLAAESHLGMCKRRTEQKGSANFRFTAGFRLLWVVLSKVWAPWRTAAQLMQPATVSAPRANRHGQELTGEFMPPTWPPTAFAGRQATD